MVTIEVTLTHMFNGRGKKVPFSNYYRCVGPDGTVFTNSNKSTLTDVLRRKYGKVTLNVTDKRRPINEY
jgi:hypothetical protein